MNFKKNKISIIVSLLLAFFICYYIPLISYLNNPNEYSFTVKSLLLVFIKPCLLVFIVSLCSLSFLSKHSPKEKLNNKKYVSIFHIIILLFIFICWLESSILSLNLPQITGESNVFNSTKRLIFDSLLILIICTVSIYFWRYLTKKTYLISFSLFILLFGGLGDAIVFGPQKSRISNTYSNVFNQMKFHPKNNVIIILPDAYSTNLLFRVLDIYPSYKNKLNGFTLFKNHTQASEHTHWSVPAILKGELDFNKDFQLFFNDTLTSRESIVNKFTRIEYDAYITSLFPSLCATFPPNEEKEFNENINLTLNLYSSFAIKFAPYLFKNKLSLNAINHVFINDDMVRDKSFFKVGISNALKNKSNKPTFHFHHLLGAHYPYVFDKNGDKLLGDNKNNIEGLYGQSEWFFHEFIRFIDKLKQYNIYESSTIVFLGDHGNKVFTENSNEYSKYASLLVKPAYSMDELLISDAPISSLYLSDLIYGVHLQDTSIEEYIIELPEIRQIRYFDSFKFFKGKDINKLELVKEINKKTEHKAQALNASINYSLDWVPATIAGRDIAVPYNTDKINCYHLGYGICLRNDGPKKDNISFKVNTLKKAINLTIHTGTLYRAGGVVENLEPYRLFIEDSNTGKKQEYNIISSSQDIEIRNVSVNKDKTINLKVSVEGLPDTKKSLRFTSVKFN